MLYYTIVLHSYYIFGVGLGQEGGATRLAVGIPISKPVKVNE